LAKVVIAFPELPGKDARSIPAYCGANKEAYVASRKRAGTSMERVYLMPTPMGNFAIAYIESAGDFATTMGSYMGPDKFDKGFIDRLHDVHGFDPTKPPPGPPPELVGDWADPSVADRRRGLAFTAPLKPGKVEAGRAFAKEAFETRLAEFTASRRANGGTREVVCVNYTPHGELVCVYLEGNDPAASNRSFAASRTPYDVWFKAECRKLFIDAIDFNDPVPPVEQIWDWQAGKA
jgi:hypothetical protein